TMAATTKEPRYRLDLVVLGNEANKRSMSGDDCSHLVDAAALILALHIDPEALTGRNAEAPSAGGPPHADADGGRPAPSPPVRSTPAERAPPETKPGLPPAASFAPPADRGRMAHTTSNTHLSAHLTLDQGSLPRTTLGVGAAVSLARGPLLFEIRGTAYEP